MTRGPRGSNIDDRGPSGRKRDPAVDSAIAAATRSIVDEDGLDALSIEAVARHAGVSRATVYRRWPNKNALVQGLLEEVARSVAIPDHGDVRADLIDLLHQQLHVIERESGRLYPSLSVSAAGDAMNDIVRQRKASLSTVLRRGIERRQLREDLDPELGFFLFWGPVYYRYMIAVAEETPIEPDFIARLVDEALAGLA